MRITGKRPDLRAEIPPELAAAVADHFGPGFAAIAMPPGYRLRQLCGVFQYIAPDGVASILFPKITQAAASAQFHANLAQCIARHNSTEAAR
jgi:acetyl-CoA carboxylase alpha subunit